MKVTYRWLKEFVDIPWSPGELAEKLTLSGSEVESVEPVQSLFESIVVGHITHCKAHPGAKHLKICKVNLGDRSETIVCGAPNVAKGQNVVVALPGSTLPNGKTIQIAKIRGTESFGMICSERELGFSDVADEIMALPQNRKPGEQFDPGNFREDVLFDIFINPNRPDCMSVYGLAREISALSGNTLRERKIALPRSQKLESDAFKITIKDTDKCPRYTGVVITGIQVRPSPYEIQQRLYAVGMRPINNIVDATNYCLIEWGHPLHAFDLKLLSGNQIVVKTAKEGQKFRTLDGVMRTLSKEVLLICDKDKPIALGGIMGGENSEIRDGTSGIFLESAYFKPQNIMRSSKFLSMNTEASHRFSRGMDPNYTIEALKRASELILKCSPGQLHKPFFDEYPKKIRKKTVVVRPERLNSILGTDLRNTEITGALKGLEVKTDIRNNQIYATVPTFRHDLTREVDFIEEVARIIGLDRIEAQQTATIKLKNVKNPREVAKAKLRSYLTEFGFMEMCGYSMIDSRLEPIYKDDYSLLFLQNPISPEMSMMRPSLLPGLVKVAEHNFNRGAENLRMFELGTTFFRDPQKTSIIRENLTLSGILYGQRVPPSWDHLDTPSDFFTIKGILESLFRKISLDIVEFISYDMQYLEECTSVSIAGRKVGFCGRYRNKSLLIDFPEPLFLFEIDTKQVLEAIRKTRYFRPYSKFPPVKRDLAFVISDAQPVQGVLRYIRETGGPFLKFVYIDDVYRGQQIDFDKRSVKFSMKFFADDRNLNDDEVDEQIQQILTSVRTKFNIDIRR